MKHLLTFNDISEDFSIYLESEDFVLNEAKESVVTASLKKKSKASGIPMGIFKKSFCKRYASLECWT